MTKRKRAKPFRVKPDPRRLGPPQEYTWLQPKRMELPDSVAAVVEGMRQRRYEEPVWPPGVIAWLEDQHRKDEQFDRLTDHWKRLAPLFAENVEPWWRWTAYVASAIVVRQTYELRDLL